MIGTPCFPTLPSPPTGKPPDPCSASPDHNVRGCIYRHEDGTWSREGSSDKLVKKENLADYPQLVEALQPWGMQYVVDAGSNDGFSTWLFARALPNATVIAIEANLGNYLMTRLNTQSLSNVHTVHAALWRSSEKLRVAGQRLGNVGINVVPMNIHTRSSETVTGVEMETLLEKA